MVTTTKIQTWVARSIVKTPEFKCNNEIIIAKYLQHKFSTEPDMVQSNLQTPISLLRLSQRAWIQKASPTSDTLEWSSNFYDIKIKIEEQ